MTVLIPLLSAGVAFLITANVDVLRQKTPMFLFFAAVLFSIWRAGWLGGMLGTLFSGIGSAWILNPRHSILIAGHDDLVRWSMFVFIALAMSYLYAARNKAERALRDSEQRLSLAIDSAHIGVWDYNLLTRKLWWSKTLEVIYSRTTGDFPSTYGQFFGCIHFDDQPLFNRAITRTIDEGDDYEIEHRIHLPDKSIRWVNTRGRLFFNADARAERIVGVVVDISARKRAEEELANLPEDSRRNDHFSSVA